MKTIKSTLIAVALMFSLSVLAAEGRYYAIDPKDPRNPVEVERCYTSKDSPGILIFEFQDGTVLMASFLACRFVPNK